MPQRRDPATIRRRVDARQKREAAVQARVRGLTWEQVAQEAGYASTGSAHAAVRDYLDKYPVPEVDELRAIENQKLDDLERHARAVLARHHVVVSQGRIAGRLTGRIKRDERGELMFRDDGKPIYEVEELEDDGPVLKAIDRLVKIAERRSKLNGIDRPVLIRLEEESSQLDADIAALLDELNSQGAPEVPGGSNESA